MSLPLWECGLKYGVWRVPVQHGWSLPLWECGLKYYNSDNSHNHFLSLPLWECGLKFRSTGLRHVNGCHSPCGSVDWNYDYLKTGTLTSVTPLVGVWIEIADRKSLEQIQMSLPLWECGLKSPGFVLIVGANPSLPLWECGLKFVTTFKFVILSRHSPCGSVDWNREVGIILLSVNLSLPLWECGLK